MVKTKVAVAFIVPSGSAVGEPPGTEEWYAKIRNGVTSKLNKLFPEMEFALHDVKNLADVSKFVEEERDVVGYMIFILGGISGLVRPILQSGKPTLLIGETYGGAGEYLLEYSRARDEGKPVVGISTTDPAEEGILKNAKLLDVINRMRNSKILFIVSPGVKQMMNIEYPLSIDLWSSIRSVQTIFGITPMILDVREFVEKYYSKADESEAKKIADKWIREAAKNEEERVDEIEKSAKLYLTMKKAVGDYEADAIAVDCIVLYRRNFLDAWPCLGYMELYKEGITVPVCEADPYSAVTLLAMKYLADLPGFVNDPSPNDRTGEVIYYHCYAPINPHGPSGKRVPYVITPAHLGGKRASVYSEFPVNETITAVGIDPESRTLILHTAEAVRNERSPQACSTKLIGKTNTKALAKNWRWRSGWHRVVFYGDWREDLEKLAALLGLNVVEEDK